MAGTAPVSHYKTIERGTVEHWGTLLHPTGPVFVISKMPYFPNIKSIEASELEKKQTEAPALKKLVHILNWLREEITERQLYILVEDQERARGDEHRISQVLNLRHARVDMSSFGHMLRTRT